MGTLTLSYAPEDDWHGELTATARTAHFSGVGIAWFTAADLHAFAARLSEYPIEDPVMLGGGFWDAGQLTTPTVSITISPFDSVGHLEVVINLSDDSLGGYGHRPQTVSTLLMVTYGDLAAFQLEMNAMLTGEQAEALLRETRT